MAATTSQTLPVGTVVGGQCVIERHLRNGVMTEVYRARREGSGRERFEIRRFTLVASSDALRAVRRELDRIESLHLLAIPALVDVIDDPVGLLVLTSTVAEGATSLRMALDAAGPLAPGECVRVVRIVAGVLDVLHGASPQVLHRRLSPETITLIGPQREVRVEECGLAQALVGAGLVNARLPLQARQYLSPDELLQRSSARGDIFTLASIAFECLTGRSAFLGATEASLSTAILRGVRPMVSALRSDVPAAVDAVLARAWSGDPSKGFLSAAAMADALATTLGVTATAPTLATRTEPSFASPPAGAPVLSRSDLNLMKATILGVGMPSRPQVAPPRPKPSEAEIRALQESSPITPTRTRLVGGRPQMPTQKVEVPRIHPPGTVRVVDDSERPTFPPFRVSSGVAAIAPNLSKNSDFFDFADVEGFDIPTAHEMNPVSGTSPQHSLAVPPPIPRVPSRSPTIMRTSVPPAPSLPEPSSSSTEISFELDVDIPASDIEDVGADTWIARSEEVRPPSLPALPRTQAISSAPESAHAVALEPAPSTAPGLSTDFNFAMDDSPSIPAFTIASDAPPPPVVTPIVLPVIVPIAPPLPPVSIPPPIVPLIEPVAGATSSDARRFGTPSQRPPPSNLGKWKIMGASVIAASAIITAGQIYLARIVRSSPSVAQPVVSLDASAVVLAEVGAAPQAEDASAAVVAVDAGTAPSTATVTTDAAAPIAAAGSDVQVFGASHDPPVEHPSRRDLDRMKTALASRVRQCIGSDSSRHLRMTLTFEGSTGRLRDLLILGNYAQPPVGTCLENLVRSQAVQPFTDSEFETNFKFSARDEED